MINFRYHIVSITAVFLALGIGVAFGGTFLDRATVDLLEGNIDRAESRIKDTESKNTELTNRLDRVVQRESSLMEAGGSLLFGGLLEDLPVVVITQSGADPELVRTVVASLEEADADLRGVLEIDDALVDDERIDVDLANAVSVPVDRPGEVRDAVLSAFRQELVTASSAIVATDDSSSGSAGDDGVDTTESEPDQASEEDVPSTEPSATPDVSETERPPILTALVDGGYLRFSPADGVVEDTPLLETGTYRFLVIGSAEPEIGENDLLKALLPDNPTNAIAAVVAVEEHDAIDDAPSSIVTEMRDDAERRQIYSTIDNIDRFTGLTAALIALRDVATVEPHHYGQAAGAGTVLPNDR